MYKWRKYIPLLLQLSAQQLAIVSSYNSIKFCINKKY